MPSLLAVMLFVAASPQAADRAFTFSALDTNRDYTLTEEEAARSAAVWTNFERFDLDGDRRLSPLEFNNLALALSVPPDPFPVPQEDAPASR